jgi:hypothetical protein
MDYKLREDHHPKRLNGLVDLSFLVSLWIRKYNADLSKYLSEVLPLLFIAVHLG